MQDVHGLVTITVTSIVLDVPDQTGRYIASDLIAGWAYLIADEQGDLIARGQGVCPGSLDSALRCAFLAAASQTKDASEIGVLVENKKAHNIFVALARSDSRVRAAAGGRTMTVMTRPHSRAIRLARAAAERVAIAALREEKLLSGHHGAERLEFEDAASARRARLTAAACEWQAAAEWRHGNRELQGRSSQEHGAKLAIAGESYGWRLVAPFRRWLAPVLHLTLREGRTQSSSAKPSRPVPASTRWFDDFSMQAAGIDEVFREAGWS